MPIEITFVYPPLNYSINLIKRNVTFIKIYIYIYIAYNRVPMYEYTFSFVFPSALIQFQIPTTALACCV